MKFYKYSTGDSVMRHKTIDKSPMMLKFLHMLHIIGSLAMLSGYISLNLTKFIQIL